MADASSEIDALILRLRARFAAIPRAFRAEAAREIKAEQDKTIRAEQDAYGAPWEPKHAGEGKFEFAKPADVIVTPSTNGIRVAVVDKVAALHHRGRAAGAIKRAIIPENRKVPAAWNRRLVTLAERLFAEASR